MPIPNGMNFEDKILHVNEDNFEELALEIFRYQATNNPVYAEYLECLKRKVHSIHSISQIPALPVEVFKHRKVLCDGIESEVYFESSGTTDHVLSKHYIPSLNWYRQVSKACFENFFGPVVGYEMLALLPHYLERGHSSLVAMVQGFVNETNSSLSRHFYLNDMNSLSASLMQALANNQKVILWGVRFAILDFADQFPGNYPDLVVIETGGMKGRRKQLSNAEYVERVCGQLKGIQLFSEYGMTELHSQSYALMPNGFAPVPWMRFAISNPHDPTEMQSVGKRGFIQIMDLANYQTCSFIQTQDMGFLGGDGSLNLLGRLDTSELRGCSLLYHD